MLLFSPAGSACGLVTDHYRILGIDPGADGAAIRARYVDEMKRAHPDRNASPDTLRRAQELTAAYAVLGDPERREMYDCQRAALERWERLGEGGSARARRFGAGGGLALLLAAAIGGAAFYYPLLEPAFVADRRVRLASEAPLSSRCAALARDPGVRAALADSLERDGLGPVALTALAASGVALSDAQTGDDGERCRATLRIDLPAGFAAGGGERAIVSEVELSAARDGAVAVEPDRELLPALASVEVAEMPAPRPAPDPLLEEVTPVVPDRVAPVVAAPPPPPRRVIEEPVRAEPARPAPPVLRRPHSVPAGPRIDVAALERQGRDFFIQAWANAGPDKRARLSSSQNAFNARLSGCASDSCRRDSYLARNVEISRIMMGD
jgi:hypothetical protein